MRRHIPYLALAALLAWALPGWAAAQPSYDSPEAAFQALAAAAKGGDAAQVETILGPGSKPIVRSGDPVADERTLEEFSNRVDERVFYERDGDAKVIVNVGFDNWPLPIPIVKKGSVWAFDTKAGLEEVFNRRVGHNELSTIDTLKAIVAAQREYYSDDFDQDGVVEYATHIVSSEGKRNGLYWPVTGDNKPSPLGPLIAEAQQEGYGKKGAPYHGYYFRILDAQGKNAKGGAYSYKKNGQMVGGFAVLAWPAAYGNSGVTTFLVNTNGVIWQKDLGSKTDSICRAMKEYDPDKTWRQLK